MITIEKEEQIRRQLALGMTEAQVVASSGVSRKAVCRIIEMLGIISRIPESDKQTVRELFAAGLPVNAVVLNAKMPRSKVVAIRRYYYVQKRQTDGGESRECPTCGAIMLHRDRCHATQKNDVKEVSIGDAEASLLLNVVSDVVELNSLQLIANPLFYYLAKRASETLEKIHGQKNGS
jgi:ribosomal protein S27AE